VFAFATSGALGLVLAIGRVYEGTDARGDASHRELFRAARQCCCAVRPVYGFGDLLHLGPESSPR
jgi:hypothetical protein